MIVLKSKMHNISRLLVHVYIRRCSKVHKNDNSTLEYYPRDLANFVARSLDPLWIAE